MKKILFKSAFAFLVSIPVTFSSCKKEPAQTIPEEPVQIELTANQRSLISAEKSFALDIFNKVISGTVDGENIMISPLSISTALSMTLNGANGATRDSMMYALRMNGLSTDILNSSNKSLTESLLNVDKRVIISIANSVWTEKNFVVKKPFTDILDSYYNAEAKSFDITDPTVPKQVNDWIFGKTNGLITNMLDALDPSTVMLLVNAIYFKGKWAYQFDKNKTIQGSFYKPGGITEQVPMMKQTADYKIFKGEGFTLAELPYGQGNFVMDVILPDDKNGLNNIVPLVTENNLNSWLNMLVTYKTDLSFPRFKYGYKKELSKILSDMGMGIAFTDLADFSNISDIRLLISFVLHQSFIETNEEGTEAAAATIVGINTTAVMEPFIVNVDHPFLYIIRETSTNSILFIGRVADPLAN